MPCIFPLARADDPRRAGFERHSCSRCLKEVELYIDGSCWGNPGPWRLGGDAPELGNRERDDPHRTEVTSNGAMTRRVFRRGDVRRRSGGCEKQLSYGDAGHLALDLSDDRRTRGFRDDSAGNGTLILAAGTLRMAQRTTVLAEETKRLSELTEAEVQVVSEHAEAAKEEVQVSRLALQAAYRPQLIDVPSRETRDRTPDPAWIRVELDKDDISRLIVPARNIGAGLALLQDVTIEWADENSASGRATYGGTPTLGVVPPGEITRAVFSWAPDAKHLMPPLNDGIVEFSADFRYTDLAGDQETVTRIDFSMPNSLGGYVTQVHFLEE